MPLLRTLLTTLHIVYYTWYAPGLRFGKFLIDGTSEKEFLYIPENYDVTADHAIDDIITALGIKNTSSSSTRPTTAFCFEDTVSRLLERAIIGRGTTLHVVSHVKTSAPASRTSFHGGETSP